MTTVNCWWQFPQLRLETAPAFTGLVAGDNVAEPRGNAACVCPLGTK